MVVLAMMAVIAAVVYFAVREYMDAVSNPAESFAREFDKLFYWGL